MIKEILNEENSSIKDVILDYSDRTNNHHQPLYFALTKRNADLAAIGYSYENFIKCEKFKIDYNYFETTPFHIKLLIEIFNKKIEKRDIYKIAITLLLHINNIKADDFVKSIGLNRKQFDNLIEYKVTDINGLFKKYDRSKLLKTLNYKTKLTLENCIHYNLVKVIKLEDIPYV